MTVFPVKLKWKIFPASCSLVWLLWTHTPPFLLQPSYFVGLSKGHFNKLFHCVLKHSMQFISISVLPYNSQTQPESQNQFSSLFLQHYLNWNMIALINSYIQFWSSMVVVEVPNCVSTSWRQKIAWNSKVYGCNYRNTFLGVGAI